MPTPTYDPLASITMNASATSVTFSSISQAYRDLILVGANVRVTNSSQVRIRFNSDTGSSYYTVYARGNGTVAASSSENTVGLRFSVNAVDSIISTAFTSHIMDYATNKHKTVLTRAGASAVETAMFVGRYASTSAITSLSIEITSGTGVISSSSTFTLYGIAA